jgi:hypothetical protein
MTNPAAFKLHHDAWGRLVLTDAQGREHVGAEPVRTFPITDPRHGISICDADGNEIVWLESLDDAPTSERQILDDELSRRHFLPVIIRVVEIEGASEPTLWLVETDRGAARFTLKSEEDVRRVAGHRVLIVDAHGVRYLIPDLRQLDAASRRILERYI